MTKPNETHDRTPHRQPRLAWGKVREADVARRMLIAAGCAHYERACAQEAS